MLRNRQEYWQKESGKYWQRRSEKALIDDLANANRIMKSMEGTYNTSITRINNEIRMLIGTLAKDNEIDISQAEKLLSKAEHKLWKKSIEETTREISSVNDNAKKQVLMFELNVMSTKERISRLEAVVGQIKANTAMIAAVQEKQVEEHLSDTFRSGYYKQIYEEYKDNNTKVFDLMERKAIKLSNGEILQVLRTPWSGSDFSERIWKREFNVAFKVKELVTQQLNTGASIDRLTKIVTDELGKDYKHHAYTLINSETAFVKSQADLKVYKDLEVDTYRHLITLDTVTSDKCRHIDESKEYPVSEAVVGDNYPPYHANCRTITVKGGKGGANKTRAARDKHSKGIKIPKDMTYQEWEKYCEI